MSKNQKIFIIVAIVVLAALSRLVKHPFNFTPIVAMSIFAGAYLGRRWALLLPLVAMLISDYFIGFYDWQVMSSVYVGIVLAYFIGRYLSARISWYGVVVSALISSFIFFAITNFSVWVFFDWYPHTWAGLANCFVMALPFFRNTLVGDLFYSSILFGCYELALLRINRKYLVVEQAKNQ